jgi:streptomycin 6-kinase
MWTEGYHHILKIITNFKNNLWITKTKIEHLYKLKRKEEKPIQAVMKKKKNVDDRKTGKRLSSLDPTANL